MESDLELKGIDSITIYHSSDICIMKQLGLWYDENTLYTLIPTKSFGLVAIQDARKGFGDGRPLVGRLVFKPAAIEWPIPKRVLVMFVSVTSVSLQGWYKKNGPWVHIKPKRR